MGGRNGWRYYNHALLPTCAPHEGVDLSELSNPDTWISKDNKDALFARWTSGWDCGHETSWWYVIKDAPFDITKLKAKRRYEITRGVKRFYVKRINAVDNIVQLYEIFIRAVAGYPAKNRPRVSREDFVHEANRWDNDGWLYGAFTKLDNQLVGFALLEDHESYIDFVSLKVMPHCEKAGVNAALIYGVLLDVNDRLSNNCYICDGSRAVFHETAFQDYLEKYFGFRKAYCSLHIRYNGHIEYVVKLLYPIRKFLRTFRNNRLISKVNAVLAMEEFAREK